MHEEEVNPDPDRSKSGGQAKKKRRKYGSTKKLLVKRKGKKKGSEKKLGKVDTSVASISHGDQDSEGESDGAQQQQNIEVEHSHEDVTTGKICSASTSAGEPGPSRRKRGASHKLLSKRKGSRKTYSNPKQTECSQDESGLWSSINYILLPQQPVVDKETPDALLKSPAEHRTQHLEHLTQEVVNDSVTLDLSLAENILHADEEIDCDKEDTWMIESENPFDSFGSESGPEPVDTQVPHLQEDMSFTQRLFWNICLLLPDEWKLDIVQNDILRITSLSPYENTTVDRVISWRNGIIKIFILGKPLPKSNFLWALTEMEEPMNVGEVSDQLVRLATLLKMVTVCEAVKMYQSVWEEAAEMNKGFIESNFNQSECFRSTDCSMIVIENQVCHACHKLKINLKKMCHRKNQKRNQERKNLRYQTKNELLAKARRLQHQKRNETRKVSKLKARIKKLVNKSSISISQDSSEELAQIFKNNYNELTEAQKIFWAEQVKAFSKKKTARTIRWNPFVIRLALHLQMISPAGFKYLENFLVLPSQRTLYDFTHVEEGKEGAQETILKSLQNELESKPRGEHERFFNLLFDELNVRSGVVISKRSGDIVGYTHLKDFEAEMAAVEAEVSGTIFKVKPATKVLVYMAQGITTNIRGVVGLYATESLTAAQLYSRTWEIIYHMESLDLRVLTLICDGASANKKFFRMHASLDADKDVVYSTKNLAALGEERPLFFMVDPPHLLKTMRNCFGNSYAHKKSRQMWKGGEDISWKVIETLYTATVKDKYRSVKLTRSHVYLTSHSCMKVIYAAQVMSKSVALALRSFQNDRRFQKYGLNETSQFILHVNNTFDCFNSDSDPLGKRNKENELLASYKELNDSRFKYLTEDVLGYFNEWKKDTEERPGKFKKDDRERMFISDQSYESLKVSIYGFLSAVQFMLSIGAPFVDGRTFNQDKLEQYFGLLRMSGGGKDNLSVAEVIQKTKSLHVQGQAARPPKRGNTEANEEEWIPDQRPLPKRPRKSN